MALRYRLVYAKQSQMRPNTSAACNAHLNVTTFGILGARATVEVYHGFYEGAPEELYPTPKNTLWRKNTSKYYPSSHCLREK